MNDSNNSYGLSTNTDTHMLKNIEWGAVAYLSHSKYGTCTDGACQNIGLNNNSDYITGCGDTAESSSSTTCNTYNTSSGMLASTTGNIYGVYDMSGGSSEYTMSNMVSKDGKNMLTGYSETSNSGYSGKLLMGLDSDEYDGINYPDDKYYDKYSFNLFSNAYSGTISKLGDSLKEVIKVDHSALWYNSSFLMVNIKNGSWFIRGAFYSASYGAGLFVTGAKAGNSVSDNSTRLVITP